MTPRPNRARSYPPPPPVALFIAAALIASPGPAHAGDVPTFAVDASWPKPLPNNWIIGQVGGIAVDGKDHIWVMHRRAR